MEKLKSLYICCVTEIIYKYQRHQKSLLTMQPPLCSFRIGTQGTILILITMQLFVQTNSVDEVTRRDILDQIRSTEKFLIYSAENLKTAIRTTNYDSCFYSTTCDYIFNTETNQLYNSSGHLSTESNIFNEMNKNLTNTKAVNGVDVVCALKIIMNGNNISLNTTNENGAAVIRQYFTGITDPDTLSLKSTQTFMNRIKTIVYDDYILSNETKQFCFRNTVNNLINPQFVSAVLGKRNIVLLIDYFGLRNNKQLITTLIRFLQTLTHGDNIVVIAYSSHENILMTNNNDPIQDKYFVRADKNNIDNLIENIMSANNTNVSNANNITNDTTIVSELVFKNVVQEGFDMFRKSSADRANCQNALILFTDTIRETDSETYIVIIDPEQQTNDLTQILKMYGDTEATVFVFDFDPKSGPTKFTQSLMTLSCATNGLYQTIRTKNTNNISLDVTLINNYIRYSILLIESNSNGEIQNTVMWTSHQGTLNVSSSESEQWVDNKSNHSVISASLPIYVDFTVDKKGRITTYLSDDETDSNSQVTIIKKFLGVLTIDINVIIDVNVANASTDFLNDFLNDDSTCQKIPIANPPRNKNEWNVMDSMIFDAGDNTCKYYRPLNEVPELQRLLPLWIFLSVVLSIVVLLIPFILASNRRFDTNNAICFVCWWIQLVCVMAILVTFWGITYDGVVDHVRYEKIVTMTEKISQNPYKCCEYAQASCNKCESYSNGSSCAYLTSILQEGYCFAGTMCCQTKCSSCNCRKSGCHYCCSCSKQVGKVKCLSTCGTCWNLDATVSTIKNGVKTFEHVTQYCGKDKTQCVNTFMQTYGPVGRNRTLFSDKYRSGGIVPWIIDYVPGMIAVIIFGCCSMINTCVILMVKCCDMDIGYRTPSAQI